jgi:hypothetical protein
MKDNSGSGKAKNNNHDVTLDEHAGGKGPAQRSAMLDQQAPGDIAGNVRLKGEDPSPDDRDRGETSSKDRAAPVDLNQ